MALCDKCYQSKIHYFLKLRNTRSIKFCVMDLVSHRVITLILFGRPAIQLLCLLNVYLFSTLSFDGFKSALLKKYFSDLNLKEAVKSSGLVVQLKLKVLLM